MAYFNLDPALLNPSAIGTQQTAPISDGTSWLFTQEFADWIDNNQPLGWLASGATGLWLEIPDARIDTIDDYLQNWVPSSA